MSHFVKVNDRFFNINRVLEVKEGTNDSDSRCYVQIAFSDDYQMRFYGDEANLVKDYFTHVAYDLKKFQGDEQETAVP